MSSVISADIYRTNMFHLAVGGCALVLQKDLEYWGIDELMMEPCCALKYYPEIEICHNEKQVRNQSPEATARLSEKAPHSEKNITLASSGWDLANIVSIMRHLLVF